MLELLPNLQRVLFGNIKLGLPAGGPLVQYLRLPLLRVRSSAACSVPERAAGLNADFCDHPRFSAEITVQLLKRGQLKNCLG